MGEHGRDCLRIARETEFTNYFVVVVVGSVSGGALLMKMLG